MCKTIAAIDRQTGQQVNPEETINATIIFKSSAWTVYQTETQTISERLTPDRCSKESGAYQCISKCFGCKNMMTITHLVK